MPPIEFKATLDDALRPGEVSKAIDESPRMLVDIMKASIGEASKEPARGRGSRRVLSIEDALLIALAQRLRRYGLSPDKIRSVCQFLQKRRLDAWSERVSGLITLKAVPKLFDSDGDMSEIPKPALAYSNSEPRWILIQERSYFSQRNNPGNWEPLGDSAGQMRTGTYILFLKGSLKIDRFTNQIGDSALILALDKLEVGFYIALIFQRYTKK